MKLTKMRKRSMSGEIQTYSYLITIPKRIVKESGISDTKELKLEVKEKEIIIKEK